MIRLVQAAEELLSQAERRILPAAVPSRPTPASALLPVLRGLLHRAAGPEAAPGRWLLDCRSSAPALELVNDQRLSRWASCGVATPDHVIRTKGRPPGAAGRAACPKPSRQPR